MAEEESMSKINQQTDSSISHEVITIKTIPKSDKYIPEETIRALNSKVDNIKDKFYLNWHIQTGVRVSDIVGQKKRGNKGRELGQEINNLDWDNNRIWTYDHKKNKWRWVYFPEEVRSLLKMWLKERQNLGINDRQIFPYSEKSCNRILKKWCKEVGFKYSNSVGSHWCRHSFIRLSRKANRDIKAVEQNTGDTFKTLLEWYADLSSEDMRKEIEDKPLVRTI